MPTLKIAVLQMLPKWNGIQMRWNAARRRRNSKRTQSMMSHFRSSVVPEPNRRDSYRHMKQFDLHLRVFSPRPRRLHSRTVPTPGLHRTSGLSKYLSTTWGRWVTFPAKCFLLRSQHFNPSSEFDAADMHCCHVFRLHQWPSYCFLVFRIFLFWLPHSWVCFLIWRFSQCLFMTLRETRSYISREFYQCHSQPSPVKYNPISDENILLYPWVDISIGLAVKKIDKNSVHVDRNLPGNVLVNWNWDSFEEVR